MHAAARVGREKAEAGGVGAREAMARLAAEFGAARVQGRFREGSGKAHLGAARALQFGEGKVMTRI